MARHEIDPFGIGRRGLAIPFREFPIWFACALWPLAVAILEEAARRGIVTVPDWANTPAEWIAMAIFDWCWMTALCRSTTIQLVTFPAERCFWLFLLLKLALDGLRWLFYAVLSILALAGYSGIIPFIDWTGSGVQLLSGGLAVAMLLLGIWVSLRLLIWPAHCVATGTLAGPRIIWRGMQDHSFDMFIIAIVTTGPALLIVGALYFFAREVSTAEIDAPLRAIVTVVKVYVTGAFDAAMLIAYFEIFAMKTAGRR